MQESSVETFEVRFYRGGPSWPSNPFGFQGPGQLAVEPDFVIVRGSSHRAFRFPKTEQQRLRKADIVNVRTSGEDVIFDVVGVQDMQQVGFSAAGREAAKALAAALPTRCTPGFEMEAHTEREVFNDRIDYWSPSTPVIRTLLAANIAIFLLMWLERQGFGTPWFKPLPGWGSAAALQGHLQLWMQGVLNVLHSSNWRLLAASFTGFGPEIHPALLQHQLVAWGSNVPRWTLGAGEWWRLVTSAFLHGNLLHLGMNMFALWQAGQLVERIFGSLRFAGLYLLAGIGGSLGSLLWGLLTHHPVNSVGASGAIFGIIGGLFAFIGREHSGVPPTVVRDLRASIGPFLLFNIGAGFLYPHTDNAAHIGGLAAGWLAGHLLARSLHVPSQRAA
ncbi:rhomboid family intramembrane serine protease [Massilia sp. LXY-6]|uniref:rhomboid family intramembrane serine protease n=1 Tax=Massilia sp. LXY-6 TaxID=3379823 RepID=UPI003EDEF39B